MKHFLLVVFSGCFSFITFADKPKVCRSNAYYYGNLIKIVDDVLNVDSCVAICDAHKQCKSANYLKDRQKCELMEDGPSESDDFSDNNDSSFVSKTCVTTNSDGSILLRPKRAKISTEKCGLPKVTPRNASTRIVGGFEAKPHSFPWVVSIQQNEKHRCGASLISDVQPSDGSRFVLSASHCFFELYNGGLTVKFGANDLSKPENTEVIDVEEVYVHPQYDPVTVANDIALLKLVKPVKFTDYIKPVCLPAQNQNFKVGTKCIAAGWGATAESGESSSKLLQVELPIMDINICNRTDWAYSGTLLKNEMLCAGYPEGARDACQGDSGGPLVTKQSNNAYIQVGVVSFGEGCAKEKSPGIYSKVSYYANWIKKTQKEALLPTTTTSSSTTTTTTSTTTTTTRPTTKRRRFRPTTTTRRVPWKPWKPWWANYNWGKWPYNGGK